MKTTNESFRVLFLEEIRRRLFEESMPRIRKCLDLLSEEELWFRPNEESNAIGNLLLHLEGNARQWILTGLGKQQDRRQRADEFSATGTLSKAALWAQLESTMQEVQAFLPTITEEQLTAVHPVQVYQENGISILVHVVEHFSYHVGQITYAVKWQKNVDTAYYEEDLG